MSKQASVTSFPQVEIPFTSPEYRTFKPVQALDKAKAAFRANYLSAYYGAAYVSNDDARNIHVFNGSVWEFVSTNELERDACAMLDASGVDYDPAEVTNIVKVMRQRNPRMSAALDNHIGFKNGVLDTKSGAFGDHKASHWLTTQNGIVWTPGVDGENLAVHAPNFYKWLSHAKYENEQREESLLAGLYMILTCRNDWELFLSISGVGGSGKSVYQRICTMMAGAHNTAAFSISGICGEFGLEHLMSSRLLLCSEADSKWPKKAIDIIKGISGGDLLPVNRKGEKVVSAVIRAILVFVGNLAADLSNIDNGGIERRKVPFNFPHAVPDSQKDDSLTDKIRQELPVIIRHLLARFPAPDAAKQALIRQRDGDEAKAIKFESSPLERFMCSLEIDPYASLAGRNGMQWNDSGRNGAGFVRMERQFIYHAYLTFCDVEGIRATLDKATLTRCIKQRFGTQLRTGKGAQNRTLVNLRVRDDADYLPHPDSSDQKVITFPGKK